MTLLKRAASGLALLDSLLVIYVFYALGTGALSLALTVIGALLLVDSGLCFYGLGAAFYGVTILSLLIIVASFLGGETFAGLPGLVLGLSAVTVVVSAVAARSESTMAEQGNPMNLPVFG